MNSGPLNFRGLYFFQKWIFFPKCKVMASKSSFSKCVFGIVLTLTVLLVLFPGDPPQNLMHLAMNSDFQKNPKFQVLPRVTYNHFGEWL